MKQPRLFSIIDKACFDYKMIEKGDRILVGASGGKDSNALIEYLANRKRRSDSDFEYICLFIKTEFTKPMPQNVLDFFQKNSVPLKILEINIEERSSKDRKLGCYWCSTQRRTELLRFAIENGCNKIALGHHLDDILETILMNALEKGLLGGMMPRMKYEKYPIELIRPLCYAPQSLIKEHAATRNYDGFTCTCSFQDNSTRKIARRKLEILTDGDEKTKQRLFNAFVKKSDSFPQ